MKTLLIVTVLVLFTLASGCTGAKDMATDLNGSSWALQRLGDTALIPDTEVTLRFEEGKVGGLAGCNNYFGSYKLEGAQISVGELGSTMMFCADPEGSMDQEIGYLAALGAAATFQVEDNILTLFDAAGARVAEFVAAAE